MVAQYNLYLQRTNKTLDTLFLSVNTILLLIFIYQHNKAEHIQILKKNAMEKMNRPKDKTTINFNMMKTKTLADVKLRKSMPNLKRTAIEEYNYQSDNGNL